MRRRRKHLRVVVDEVASGRRGQLPSPADVCQVLESTRRAEELKLWKERVINEHKKQETKNSAVTAWAEFGRSLVLSLLKAASRTFLFPQVAVCVSLRECGWTDRREACRWLGRRETHLDVTLSKTAWEASAGVDPENLPKKLPKYVNGRLGW